jgi:hypothetical protein
MPDWAHDELLEVSTVAATARVTEQTIRNYIVAGMLPALRIGGRVRVLRPDPDKLASQRYQPCHTPAEDAVTAEAFWDGSAVLLPADA